MSIFEVIMLICFGAAWPLSIYKSYRSKRIEGKSPAFLVVVIIGYMAGILHKMFYSHDWVIYLYILNFCMVSIDFILYIQNAGRLKNRHLTNKA